jgi:hypothetical protein
MEAKEFKFGLLIAASLVGGSCCQSSTQAGEPLGTAQREEIYERAKVQFKVADFFKPKGESSELTFRLAPLILQEASVTKGQVGSAETDSPRKVSGSVAENLSDCVLTLKAPAPTIYVMADSIQIHGQAHLQFTYLWFYPVSGPAGQVQVQGFRLTLNTAGDPVIWEVLPDPTGARVVFAAQSLEAAAQARFGKPFPGCRFTIERPVADAPETVAARIIDDGPVPMGPIVYLKHRSHAVSTLICRCMPAQAKRVARTKTYRLAVVSRAEACALPNVVNVSELRAFLHQNRRRGLQEALRLPDSF